MSVTKSITKAGIFLKTNRNTYLAQPERIAINFVDRNKDVHVVQEENIMKNCYIERHGAISDPDCERFMKHNYPFKYIGDMKDK